MCEYFFPQWTRPDGTRAGLIWKTGATERIPLRFAVDTDATSASKLPTITFRNYTGRIVAPARGADGAYLVPIGESPLFFEGGVLAGIE